MDAPAHLRTSSLGLSLAAAYDRANVSSACATVTGTSVVRRSSLLGVRARAQG